MHTSSSRKTGERRHMEYDPWKKQKIKLTALRGLCEEITGAYTHDLALAAVDNCSEILQKEDFGFEIDEKIKEENF